MHKTRTMTCCAAVGSADDTATAVQGDADAFGFTGVDGVAANDGRAVAWLEQYPRLIEDLGEACLQAHLVDEQAIQFGERRSQCLASERPKLAFSLLGPCAAPLDRTRDFNLVIHKYSLLLSWTRPVERRDR